MFYRISRPVSRGASILLLVLSLIGLVTAGQAAQPAVAYQLNPAHDGSVGLYGFTFPLARQWTVDLGQTVSYPLIASGRVFVTVADNSSPSRRLVALDQPTGAILWQQPLGGSYWRVNAAYDNAGVFTVDGSGLMQAWDAASGALRWRTQLPGQYFFSSAPTAVNGIVYVGGAGSGGTLYAVRETDGGIIWTASVENGDECSPAATFKSGVIPP